MNSISEIIIEEIKAVDVGSSQERSSKIYSFFFNWFENGAQLPTLAENLIVVLEKLRELNLDKIDKEQSSCEYVVGLLASVILNQVQCFTLDIIVAHPHAFQVGIVDVLLKAGSMITKTHNWVEFSRLKTLKAIHSYVRKTYRTLRDRLKEVLVKIDKDSYSLFVAMINWAQLQVEIETLRDLNKEETDAQLLSSLGMVCNAIQQCLSSRTEHFSMDIFPDINVEHAIELCQILSISLTGDSAVKWFAIHPAKCMALSNQMNDLRTSLKRFSGDPRLNHLKIFDTITSGLAKLNSICESVHIADRHIDEAAMTFDQPAMIGNALKIFADFLHEFLQPLSADKSRDLMQDLVKYVIPESLIPISGEISRWIQEFYKANSSMLTISNALWDALTHSELGGDDVENGILFIAKHLVSTLYIPQTLLLDTVHRHAKVVSLLDLLVKRFHKTFSDTSIATVNHVSIEKRICEFVFGLEEELKTQTHAEVLTCHQTTIRDTQLYQRLLNLRQLYAQLLKAWFPYELKHIDVELLVRAGNFSKKLPKSSEYPVTTVLISILPSLIAANTAMRFIKNSRGEEISKALDAIDCIYERTKENLEQGSTIRRDFEQLFGSAVEKIRQLKSQVICFTQTQEETKIELKNGRQCKKKKKSQGSAKHASKQDRGPLQQEDLHPQIISHNSVHESLFLGFIATPQASSIDESLKSSYDSIETNRSLLTDDQLDSKRPAVDKLARESTLFSNFVSTKQDLGNLAEEITEKHLNPTQSIHPSARREPQHTPTTLPPAVQSDVVPGIATVPVSNRFETKDNPEWQQVVHKSKPKYTWSKVAADPFPAKQNTTVVLRSNEKNKVNKIAASTASLEEQIASLKLEMEKKVKEAARSASESKTCCICLEKPSIIAFTPCGHIICCSSCADAVEQCPACRKSIEIRTRVYL